MDHEPMTKRGQAFIAKWTDEGEYVFGRDMNDAIIAIEAEARAVLRDELEAAMDALWRERRWLSIEDSAAKRAVLDEINPRRP